MLSERVLRLQELLTRPRWCVGFSGGLDSTVLLYLLHDYLRQQHARHQPVRPQHLSHPYPHPHPHMRHQPPRQEQPGQEQQVHEQGASAALPELIALHVNHGLSPNADGWQRHCEQVCDALALPCYSVSVVVAAAAGEGLEAAARSARYAAFAERLNPNDVLLLAHHADDQIETVLLKLFRSSGISGLAGMRERAVINGQLRVRPLLGVGRAELQDFAAARDLRWIEDASNNDVALSRNFVRHRVLPVLQEHWPHGGRQLLSVARAAQDSALVLDEVADQDLANIAGRDGWGCKLALVPLQSLSPPRIKNALTRWLHRLGVPALRQRQWPVFFEQLLKGQAERTPVLALVGGSLRGYRGAVYWVPDALAPLAPLAAGGSGPPDGEVGCVLPGACALGVGGTLHGRCDEAGGGLRAGQYRVSWRGCSERWRSQRQTRALKRALAAAGVPPWWRDRVPLLFAEATPSGAASASPVSADLMLAAVADAYVNPAFLARAGESGARLSWQPPSAWQPAGGRKVIEAEG